MPAGRWEWLVGVALVCAVAACGSDAVVDGSTSLPAVCPTCPQTGGESTDFGGTPTLCGGLKTKVDISEQEARALDFDIDVLVATVERKLEGTLTWDAPEAKAFVELPAGYETTTRILVASTITGYHHARLDPSICRDGVCTRAGASVMESECPDHLELDTQVTLRTEDGAVEATMTGYVLQDRPDGPFERPAGSAWVDLADVRGAMNVVPLPARDAPLRTALLRGDLYFGARTESGEEVRGDVRLWFEYSRGDGVSQEVSPLHGAWRASTTPSGP